MTSSILRLAAARRNRFRLPHRVRAAVLCLMVAAGPGRADIQQATPGGGRDDKDKPARQDNIRRAAEIPTPQDATVTVLREVPTRIVLSSTAALRQPVIFRLGERPAHGALSDPRPSSEGNTKAVVTYTAGPGSATSDSFTFRVKHRETATSGSATVRIRIIDPVPDLEVPGDLDFGETVVGETSVRPLVLVNRGTAAFAATLKCDPPWRLMQESPKVWVEAGGRLEVRIAYTPHHPGEATARLEYPGDAEAVTRLVGRAVAPVLLQPSLVQLTWDPAARMRRSVATVTNRLDASIDFTVSGSPRLTFSEERGTLPPRGTAEITVGVPLPDAMDLQSMLSVVAAGVREEVPLTAPPPPPVLTLREMAGWQRDGETTLNLPSGVPEGALVFANDGGEAAALVVSLPDGWSSPGLENVATLAPRETRRLLLVPPPNRPDSVTGTLEVRLHEERLRLELTAAAGAPPAAELSTPAGPDALLTAAPPRGVESGGRPLTAQEQRMQWMADTLGIFPHDIRFDRSLPQLEAVTVGQMKPDRVELSLKSVGGVFTYIVFRDVYRPPPGSTRPTRHWLPIDGLKWKTSGEIVATALDQLKPGERILLRFAARTADGRVGPPSNPIILTMPAPKPQRWRWIAAGMGLAATGWWWWRRKVR